jgi:hypothetical protein
MPLVLGWERGREGECVCACVCVRARVCVREREMCVHVCIGCTVNNQAGVNAIKSFHFSVADKPDE